MFSRSGQQPQQDEFEGKSEIRDAVARGKPVNPALQRLQARVLRSTDASEVITSYDRMHHRHNRS
ncbi:YhhA family cyclophane-containing RiPP [Xenophilus azovorans]|uniref:YhhA family cyclophane-containing RiPP n=1 Tax=Xenophilus azovorans TaxID=151755 RepID=UPI00057040BE|nr:YhhA family cyclophane-containing RiPP [Xenophilus azovorans]